MIKNKNKYHTLIAGCGYIGKKVAALLLQKKTSISALVNNAKSKQHCDNLQIPCSLINLDNTAINSLDTDAETILYLIAPQAQGETDIRLNNFLKKIITPPDYFILISTTGVYGNCNGQWINEESPTDAQADRAKRRLNAEQQAKDYCNKHNIHLSILRVAGIYAKDKLPIKRLQKNEAILCEAESGFSNRIHADDLARICAQACTQHSFEGIYNCTDGSPSSMCDYFKRVALACNLTAPQEINMQQARQELSVGMISYLVESKRIDNTKLLSVLSEPLSYPNIEMGLKNIK